LFSPKRIAALNTDRFFQSPKNHARRQRDEMNEALFAVRRIVRPVNAEAFADILRGRSPSLARERVCVRL
jgi:hypothetical protein